MSQKNKLKRIHPYPATPKDKQAKKLRLINWYSEESKNIGKRKTIRDESVEIKDDVNGKTYTMKTLAGKATNESYELHQSVLVEAPTVGGVQNAGIIDRLTVDDLDGVMTDQQISELKKLIRKGADDLTQQWKNALELTNKAFQVMRLPIPHPDQKEAWSQYLNIIAFSVRNLARTRGQTGSWRITGLGLKQ